MNLQTIPIKLTVSNILNGVFIILVLIVLFNPSAKALLIRGLMQVGLFQPDISQPIETASNSGLPNISFQNANGEMTNLRDQKGKVIFMNFWATWCPPCIAEMPSINKLYEKLKGNQNIIFIMVDADHDFTKSVPFMKLQQYMLPLYEANDQIPESILRGSIPTTIIFNKNGQIVFRHEGAGDYNGSQVTNYLLKLSR